MGVRSRTTALVLALLFGPWTWAYTYKTDSTKLFVGVVLQAVAVIIILIRLSSAFNNVALECNVGWVPAPGCTSAGLAIPPPVFVMWGVSAVFWLWSIILAASRDDQWYAEYANS